MGAAIEEAGALDECQRAGQRLAEARAGILESALRALGELMAGEPFVVLKGADYMRRLYPGPARRPMQDAGARTLGKDTDARDRWPAGLDDRASSPTASQRPTWSRTRWACASEMRMATCSGSSPWERATRRP